MSPPIPAAPEPAAERVPCDAPATESMLFPDAMEVAAAADPPAAAPEPPPPQLISKTTPMPNTMIRELPPGDRASLRPLAEKFPHMRACLYAVIENSYGQAWSDGSSAPEAALVRLLDFSHPAGDADSPAAVALAAAISPGDTVVAQSPDWERPLRSVFGERVSRRTRTAMHPGNFDRSRLLAFMAQLSSGFRLVRIDASNIDRFAALDGALVDAFPSRAEFLAHGVGFGVEHDNRFVAGASSLALASDHLEIEIDTHLDFRRRGFATVVGAAIVDYCVERGITPGWDAHNPPSAALAMKLGFVDPSPYDAWLVSRG
jgi:GNAT superfamily N-acetyltransferase